MSEVNMATISPAGYTATNKEPIKEVIEKTVVDNTDKVLTASEVEPKKEAIQEEKTDADKDVSETIDEMNSFLDNMKRNISFSIDEDLGKSVIVVKDAESDEVIRQMPSEELMVLRKKMDDVAGILFDTKV